MATSANDRLKQLLAAKLNKAKQDESQKANQAEQSQVRDPETSIKQDSVGQTGQEKLQNNKEGSVEPNLKQERKEEFPSAGSSEVAEVQSYEIALAETSVSKEISEARAAFFETPFGRMMQEFQAALDNQLPGMASILRDIHLHLSKDVDIVTQLSDEEIGSIVRGLESIKGQTIVTNPKTGKSTGGKKMPVSASML